MSVKNEKKLRVLHLASFSGNIGDVANHQGFYNKFNEKVPAEFTPLEIRRFYRNRSEMSFDETFVEMVNRYDLLVLGGGGFFDLRWDDSHTGTTMDFSKQMIEDIKTPVLVNAMGYHEFDEIKQENIDKFKEFITSIAEDPSWFVSVRNDGSRGRMRARYGGVMDEIPSVPDNGFFFQPQDIDRCQLESAKTTWIGLNITNDLFLRSFNHELSCESFNELMSALICRLLQERTDNKIILFPHTHQDIETMSVILRQVDDKYKRERIVIAPLFIEGKSVEHVFNLYRICSLVIAMRFHANVCCIAMNIPTIGLAGHEQIASLYDELGLKERCVKADGLQFVDVLLARVRESLMSEGSIKQSYVHITQRLAEQSDAYFNRVREWIC